MKKFNSIFLIDNDPISNFVSEKVIGFLEITNDVKAFSGAKDVIEYLSDKCPAPDVILLDIDMPCMNGFQFLNALKKLDVKDNIDVVILSTSVHSENIDLVKSMGIQYYVAKPLDMDKMKKISELIGNKYNEFTLLN
jgi:CheY-like chemotaxis protein